jgi:hypothetical protein
MVVCPRELRLHNPFYTLENVYFQRLRSGLFVISGLVFCFGGTLKSQEPDLKPQVGTYVTQCSAGIGQTAPCTITVWTPRALSELLASERKASKKYVDDVLAARLEKLNSDLVAKAVAANVKTSVINDIVQTLPNNPDFAAAVLSALVEKAKSDKTFADLLKQLILDPKANQPKSNVTKKPAVPGQP